jgi:two-component system cell cycle response regulator
MTARSTHGQPSDKILVVDDDPSILETLTTMLRFRGYATHVAATGRKALEEVRGWDPDLVLLDIMLPDIDGYEICRRLKSDRETSDIPILIVSARTRREEIVSLLELGANDYITKPFFLDEVIARVRTNLDAKKYRDSLSEENRQLEAMLAISQAVTSSLALADVLGTIVATLTETVHCNRASILKVLDVDKAQVVTSTDPDQSPDRILRLDRYPEVLNALDESRPINIENHLTDHRLEPVRDLFPDRKARALLAVPLPFKAHETGRYVLHVERPNLAFTGKDVRFCELVANHVANSIYNAQLYQEKALDNERLERLANTDPLTELHNHGFLRRRLESEVERAMRYASDLSCIMIDIDRFKSINDRYGHLRGDEVLREIANIIQRSIRKIDIGARYGGEEFVVLLPETSLEGGYQQAERIRREVKAHYFDAIDGGRVTVSCGVATLTRDPGQSEQRFTPDWLIGAADNALYAAKRAGRDRTISAGRAPAPAEAPVATRQALVSTEHAAPLSTGPVSAGERTASATERSATAAETPVSGTPVSARS